MQEEEVVQRADSQVLNSKLEEDKEENKEGDNTEREQIDNFNENLQNVLSQKMV